MRHAERATSARPLPGSTGPREAHWCTTAPFLTKLFRRQLRRRQEKSCEAKAYCRATQDVVLGFLAEAGRSDHSLLPWILMGRAQKKQVQQTSRTETVSSAVWASLRTAPHCCLSTPVISSALRHRRSLPVRQHRPVNTPPEQGSLHRFARRPLPKPSRQRSPAV